MPDAPAYPGYKALECNGCGACYLAVPCSVSAQFDLWKDGRCRALRFAAGRYWCDAVINPRRVSVRLARYPKATIVDAMGAGHGCDHRRATSIEDALELLEQSNICDDLGLEGYPSYPRACTLHLAGELWHVCKLTADAEPQIERVDLSKHWGANFVPVSEWQAPA